MADQVLSDVRVLDLTTGISGPYAGKTFADYGADVIKIEPPEGDPARRFGPFLDDVPHPETSALFLHLNRNKRGITLDISKPTGQELFKQLVQTADIVLESFPPRTMESWGLGWEDLKKIKPDLVMGRFTPFGQTGPYKDYRGGDLVYYAWGPLISSGTPELGPIRKTLHMVEYQAGATFATAVMGAFLVARMQGVGQEVDVAGHETQLGSVDRRNFLLLSYQYSGEVSQRRDGMTGPLPNGIYPCLDGYVQIMTTLHWMPRMLKTLNNPELTELFSDIREAMDPDNEDLVLAALYPWLMSHTKQECFELAEANGWPVMPLNTIEDVMNDPHFSQRNFFIDIDHPVAGTQRYAGPPWRMEEGGFEVRYPAPLLGQHNLEIYCDELGIQRRRLVRLRQLQVI